MTTARKPPHSVRVLQQWVGDLARDQGIAPGRVQRWISFMVVAAMLDHARDENEDPMFLLKGGAAMELRLGLRARATKDFDTAYREAIDGMLERLDAALRQGFGDFTAIRTEAEPIAETASQRLDIKLTADAPGERSSWRSPRRKARPAARSTVSPASHSTRWG